MSSSFTTNLQDRGLWRDARRVRQKIIARQRQACYGFCRKCYKFVAFLTNMPNWDAIKTTSVEEGLPAHIIAAEPMQIAFLDGLYGEKDAKVEKRLDEINWDMLDIEKLKKYVAKFPLDVKKRLDPFTRDIY